MTMLKPKMKRSSMISRNFTGGSIAAMMTARKRQRGGFLQALLPIIGSLTPMVIDGIASLFGGKKKEGSGIMAETKGPKQLQSMEENRRKFAMKYGIPINDVSKYTLDKFGELVPRQDSTALKKMLNDGPDNIPGWNGRRDKYNQIMNEIRPGSKLLEMKDAGIAPIGTGIRIVRRGSGFFDWIKKAISFIVPAAKKGFEATKKIVPQVTDVINQGKAMIPGVQGLITDAKAIGNQAIGALKNGDISKIGNIISDGKNLINKGVSVVDQGRAIYDKGKNIYGDVSSTITSIKDILNHNQKMKEQAEANKLAEIAKQTQSRTIDNVREARINSSVVTADHLTASNPALAVVGGDTVNSVGSGLISSLLRKNTSRMIKRRGKGFKKC